MKSVYAFRSWIEPGCAREDTVYLFGTFAEARLILDVDLWEAWPHFWRNLQFMTCVRGQKRQDVNLLPFLSGHGPGGVSFAFDADCKPIGLPEELPEDEPLEQMTYRIDWS